MPIHIYSFFYIQLGHQSNLIRFALKIELVPPLLPIEKSRKHKEYSMH